MWLSGTFSEIFDVTLRRLHKVAGGIFCEQFWVFVVSPLLLNVMQCVAQTRGNIVEKNAVQRQVVTLNKEAGCQV